jgi:SAM-dependent methyltransferase
MTLIAERAQAPVACAVELGCSVGRGLVELSRGAQLVVGVDLHLGALLSARRLLLGEPLRYARRILGRHYALAQIAAGANLGSRVAVICGDALDPPLLPQGFSRVVACNLLDSVRSPAGLLSVVDGLCAPGGELLLTSPYSWQSGVVDEGARIGGADPAADLRTILHSGGRGLVAGLEAAYTIEDDRDLRWELRRDARSAQTYAVHALRARKAALPD